MQSAITTRQVVITGLRKWNFAAPFSAPSSRGRLPCLVIGDLLIRKVAAPLCCGAQKVRSCDSRRKQVVFRPELFWKNWIRRKCGNRVTNSNWKINPPDKRFLYSASVTPSGVLVFFLIDFHGLRGSTRSTRGYPPSSLSGLIRRRRSIDASRRRSIGASLRRSIGASRRRFGRL